MKGICTIKRERGHCCEREEQESAGTAASEMTAKKKVRVKGLKKQEGQCEKMIEWEVD